MRLEITAVAGTGVVPFQPVELSVLLPSVTAAAENSRTGVQLHRALSGRWPGCVFTVAGRDLHDLHPGRRPLTDGAVVVVDAAPTGDRATRQATPWRTAAPGHALLAVRSGPGAGAVFPLRRGSYRVGRGHCEISIADPALSRHHGTLMVGRESMTLTPAPGSSGFTLVRGWREAPTASAIHVKGAVKVEMGDLIRCGMTSCSIVLDTPAAASSPAAGSALRRAAGLLDAAALEPLPVPHATVPSIGRWAVLVAGLLPLVIGVVFAWLTGSWMFVAFAGMGAVAVLIPLLGGSKRRRSFAAVTGAATDRDAARRIAAFPDADELVARAHRSHVANAPDTAGDPVQRCSPPGRQVALRVGTAEQPALLALTPAIGGYSPPLVGELPVAVPVQAGVLTVDGTATARELLLNFVLMQLDAAAIPVVVMGAVPDLPLPARFLPQTLLTASVPAAVAAVAAFSRAADGPAPGARPGVASTDSMAGVPPCVLITIHEAPDVIAAAFPGLRVIHFSPQDAGGTRPLSKSNVQLSLPVVGATGRVDGMAFVPDGVPAAVFSKYARDRGRSGHSMSVDMTPHAIPHPDKSTVEAVMDAWRANTNAPLGPVSIGQSQHGEESFDFSHDGPHLLVGGTTGSGKSEFLRTLVGSLAAAHSPADLQFVLVDFKGGAGLGPLQRFPHTTSLITDLTGHGMERTLASLRAEIHQRETLLGRAEASDSDAYRAMVAGAVAARRGGPGDNREHHAPAGMAHLVVVIDEFRVLVDQFPDSMAELMRIAAVGRSLGIHLVMATQRPQGALNADIRANVTSSVCLRVQTSFDSQDVIGSGIAADISVDTPGRAFIRRAGAAPLEFQCATLRLPDSCHGEGRTVELAADVLVANAGKSGRAGAAYASSWSPGLGRAGPPVASSDVAPVASLLSEAWSLLAGQDPTVLAAPPIVARELPLELDGTGAGPVPECMDPESIRLGLVDVPERQSLEPLLWCPEQHSHVACVGRPSAASAVVALFTEQLITANPLRTRDRQRFLYLLDGDGSLARWSAHPQVGSHVTPNHLRTAARLLARLTEVASSLQSTPVLCVSDWGRWVGALRSSPWPWAEDAVAELLRQGQVTVVIGGERELLSAPFMAAIPNRIYLPFGASAESRLLWPKTPQFPGAPGRAAVMGPFNASATQGPADAAHISQLARLDPAPQGTGPEHWTAAPKSTALPLAVTDLPDTLSPADARVALAKAAINNGDGLRRRHGASIVLGLGGDGATPVSINITPGTVLPVLGGPGSGKTTFLTALKALNAPPCGGEPESGGNFDAIAWVDDPANLSTEQQRALTQALAAGKSMVVALPNHLPSLARFPVEWGLRNAEQGVVLLPRRAQDGELFGVRLDTAGAEPLGRAVLIERGRCEWFQFPHQRTG